jgi:hypothetical protein
MYINLGIFWNSIPKKTVFGGCLNADFDNLNQRDMIRQAHHVYEKLIMYTKSSSCKGLAQRALRAC